MRKKASRRGTRDAPKAQKIGRQLAATAFAGEVERFAAENAAHSKILERIPDLLERNSL
jgi:hypothetical protein